MAHCVLPDPVRPVMSQPRTKSSIVHDSPPSRRTILPELSAASTLHRANARQRPMTTKRERRREQKIAGQRTGHAQKVKEDIKTFHRWIWA